MCRKTGCYYIEIIQYENGDKVAFHYDRHNNLLYTQHL